MTFYMREYTSEEKYDISKFLDFQNGVYDVIASPFLSKLMQLPTVRYYNVNDGFKEVDLIASEVYGSLFFVYLIQFYNGDFRETFPEGTVLNLFDSADLEELYYTMFNKQNVEGN